MKCIIGIDIGGTDIKFGKFYLEELVEKKRISTNKTDNGKYILDEVFAVVDELVGADELIALGIGVPGPTVNGVVLGAQNLGWKETNVKEIILNRYPNIVCTVLNDANAATIGEVNYGGGANYKDIVFVTLGTGIGGGIIMNRKLVEGYSGSCGEIGHLRVGFTNRRKCTCGLYDCVERYASATGIVQTANEIRLNRRTRLNQYEELTSKIVFDLAKEGDSVALEAVEEMIEKLATALSQVANTINPEAFVIGGGVSKAGDFLIEKLEKRFKELAFFSVRNVKFELAKLGNDAGIFGNMRRVLEEIYNAN